jgi:hypothetical protein
VNPEELERRRPVWTALAELWLDTELDDADRDSLAAALARSEFDELELRAIHDGEVAPAVAANLDSVAGEWSGFDPDWLAERCAAAAEERRGLLGRLRELLRASGRKARTGALLDDVLARVARVRSHAGGTDDRAPFTTR